MNFAFLRLIAVTLFYCGFSMITVSAQGKLEGYLIDKANNQPIPFAHISITGDARLGTVSNEDGLFRLDSAAVANSDTLLITHINYGSYFLSVRLFRQQGNSKIFLTESVT